MLAVVESAIGGVLPAVLNRQREGIARCGPLFPDPWWPGSQPCSEVQDEGTLAAPEMPHVHALGAADPQPLRQRVVHVTEERQRGLMLADGRQVVLASPLEPARHDVVGQFRGGW